MRWSIKDGVLKEDSLIGVDSRNRSDDQRGTDPDFFHTDENDVDGKIERNLKLFFLWEVWDIVKDGNVQRLVDTELIFCREGAVIDQGKVVCLHEHFLAD